MTIVEIMAELERSAALQKRAESPMMWQNIPVVGNPRPDGSDRALHMGVDYGFVQERSRSVYLYGDFTAPLATEGQMGQTLPRLQKYQKKRRRRIDPELKDYLDAVAEAIDYRLQVWCQGGEWNWTEEQLGLPPCPVQAGRLSFAKAILKFVDDRDPRRFGWYGRRHEGERAQWDDNPPNSLKDWPYSAEHPVPTLDEWKAGKR